MDVITRFGLEELLVVANTRHGPGGHYHARARIDEAMHDHLADGADARHFIEAHAVPVPAGPPDAGSLADLRLIARHARQLAGDPCEVETAALAELDPRPAASTATDAAVGRLFERHAFRLRPDGAVVAGGPADDWAGFVAELLPPLVVLRKERDRLRLCGNPLCRFMFVDRSRNASRRWCDPATCGNRVRGHRHRLRFATI